MMMRRKPEKLKPTALACGMLEDNGRVLFLVKKDERGIECLEMPCVLVYSGGNPLSEITEEFKRQTGIDGQVHESIKEGKQNVGSRRKKHWITVLVFRITAKNRTAKPSNEFSGFKWLDFDNAKNQRLSRKLEWIRVIG
ncbi:MAG: NUDIX hydrolase [Candidatus Micrarchaeota archaeon]